MRKDSNSLCHLRLRRTYLRYNERYFDGKLSVDADVFFAPIDGCYATFSEYDEEAVIQIDSKYSLSSQMWKQSLLHEMAHYSSGAWNHGKRFYAEIDRLYAAGAYKGLL